MTKQIIPFNEIRFAECLAYLSTTKRATFDKFEAVKLHVMIDVLHTLEQGVPIIGGVFEPWTKGPLASEAFLAVSAWTDSFDKAQQTSLLRVVDEDGNGKVLKAAGEPISVDNFSRSEIQAMEGAWEIVGNPDREKVQQYFHSKDTPIGAAYLAAKDRQDALAWEDILAAYPDKHHLIAFIGS